MKQKLLQDAGILPSQYHDDRPAANRPENDGRTAKKIPYETEQPAKNTISSSSSEDEYYVGASLFVSFLGCTFVFLFLSPFLDVCRFLFVFPFSFFPFKEEKPSPIVFFLAESPNRVILFLAEVQTEQYLSKK